ncbi:MAG: endonuclease/exonuclease/phosphatase family protein [bacterium]
MSFRVVTFNMQNGQGWVEDDSVEPSIDLAAVADFLKGLDADVICLQEVERGHDGGLQIQPPPHYGQLKLLLDGYHSVFSYPLINDTELPFGLGLAIFSRTRLADFHKIDLPAAGPEFEYEGKKRCPSSRLLIEVSTEWGGRSLKILNTHLQAFFMIGDSSDAHPVQRNIVETKLRDLALQPAILAGDMNVSPTESLVQQFEGTGFRTVQKTEATWRRMPFVTDHLFHSSLLRVVSQRVEKTSVSDHHAVVADFELW